MTETTTQGFRTDLLGRWGEPVEFEVTKERLQAYAAATNDVIPQHSSGEYGSPLFAVVPAFQSFGGATSQVVPPELLMRVVHGEQDMRLHKPILPDTTIVTRSAPIGIHKRSSGVVVGTKVETTDKESGDLLVEQYMTAFFRGADEDVSAGEEVPGHSFDESLRERDPDAEVSQTFDADQTFRYSEASGDPMPIHLDEDFAKSVGLPGIIIHGLCTMAFTSVAVIQRFCPDDPQRLDRIAVRFSKIVRPEQTITTRMWRTDGAVAYETSNEEGELVIKDGFAEIAA